MAAFLDAQKLRLVFQSRPDILEGISQAADTPARVSLFNEIANFVFERYNGSEEPTAKRRRVVVGEHEHGQTLVAANGNAATDGAAAGLDSLAAAAAGEQLLLEIKDISVSVPQRKKFDLCFTKSYLYARAPATTAPVPGIIYAWKNIEYLFYLPIPEKSQLQYNFVLFPQNTSFPSRTAPSPEIEPLLFTIPSTAPKPNTVAGPNFNAAAAVSDEYSSLFDWALTTSLHAAGNKTARIVSADPKIFHSVIRQAHRPGEPAVHVKAFRGSKDGYLFFLPTGILWGFKKPLLFIPLDRIAAISYTSVLQRTFNIVVEVEGIGDDGTNEEIEFAMLDQEDYAGIDTTYVRRHGLQDRSMAAARKAKRELVEGQRKAGAGGENGEAGDGEHAADGDGDDGLTELERAEREAEQQLQDEEDDEEEDYDPGSEGESEGEGGSSEEEEEEQGEGEEQEGFYDDDDENEDEDGE